MVEVASKYITEYDFVNQYPGLPYCVDN